MPTLDSVSFAVVSAVMVFSALMSVHTRNLVHAVLWLGLTLAGTSIFYILLTAPFLAVIQIVLYTGGVLTLMLFGVMLTRRASEEDGTHINAESRGHNRALPVVAIVAGLLTLAIKRSPSVTLVSAQVKATETAALGKSILSAHLLAFELLSVLLLAAMIGAIVIARRKDATHEAEGDARSRAGALPRTSAISRRGLRDRGGDA